MDDFFSKYGWLVVVGIIIVGVITFMPSVSTAISNAIKLFISNFSTHVSGAITGLSGS